MKQVPEEPIKQVPEEPIKQVPEEPIKQVPEEPIKQVPEEILEEFLEQVSEETLKESSEIPKNAQQKNDQNEMPVSKELERVVVKYVKIDNEIKEKQQELKELRKKRGKYEEKILTWFDDEGEKVIEITDGKLRKNKAETMIPLKKDFIENKIKDKVNDPKLVQEIMKSLNQRPKNVRVNLKRTRKRNKGKTISKAKIKQKLKSKQKK